MCIYIYIYIYYIYTVDIDILVTSRNGHTKIMQSIRITRSSSKEWKWNQLSQFRWTSTKAISIEK